MIFRAAQQELRPPSEPISRALGQTPGPFSWLLGNSRNLLFNIIGEIMASAEIKKQISIFLPITDWKALRYEAARQHVPITELCRRWIVPEISKLPDSAAMKAREVC